MKKNKHYFLRLAILKTMMSGCTYLFMPVLAEIYHDYIGYKYVGYTVFGAGVIILGNIILLFRAWALAFDGEMRRDFHKDN